MHCAFAHTANPSFVFSFTCRVRLLKSHAVVKPKKNACVRCYERNGRAAATARETTATATLSTTPTERNPRVHRKRSNLQIRNLPDLLKILIDRNQQTRMGTRNRNRTLNDPVLPITGVNAVPATTDRPSIAVADLATNAVVLVGTIIGIIPVMEAILVAVLQGPGRTIHTIHRVGVEGLLPTVRPCGDRLLHTTGGVRLLRDLQLPDIAIGIWPLWIATTTLDVVGHRRGAHAVGPSVAVVVERVAATRLAPDRAVTAARAVAIAVLVDSVGGRRETVVVPTVLRHDLRTTPPDLRRRRHHLRETVRRLRTWNTQRK
jgi:hypothetical protein